MDYPAHTPLILRIMTMFLLALAGCGQHDSQGTDGMKRDDAEITRLLDAALLSQAPIDSFKTLLSKVQSYPSVDSAWISGVTFFVKYKQGGIVSWTAPPPPHQPATN
jgi:hypothetical protein